MSKSTGKVLIVLITASSQKEAMKIGQAVMAERLAACVNLVPAVTSLFHWEGNVHKSREVLMIFKTTERRYAALEKKILSIHSYEVPEVIAVRVDRGFDRYLGWIRQETATN